LEKGMVKQKTTDESRKNIPSTTTEEEDLVTAGQRRINFIWEVTQAIIAVSITWATIYGELNDKSSTIITAGFFLVVGVYLQRTNHQSIGGVGKKTNENKYYDGR
jgi:hypothetical protein